MADESICTSPPKPEPGPLDITFLASPAIAPGAIALSSLPGGKYGGVKRNIVSDLKAIREAGIDEVFCLCTTSELGRYKIPSLLDEYKASGLTVHHFPMEDGSPPSEEQLKSILPLLHAACSSERKSLIHCRGGLGRSGTVLAVYIMCRFPDLSAEATIEKLRALRGPGAIQTVKQYNLLHECKPSLDLLAKS
eukprot:tig00001030_g6470.t1